MGARRPVLRRAAELREVQSVRAREAVEVADARDPRRAGFPRAAGTGHLHVHRASAPRCREQATRVPERKSLGAEAEQQPALAQDGIRLAGRAPEEVTGERYFFGGRGLLFLAGVFWLYGS